MLLRNYDNIMAARQLTGYDVMFGDTTKDFGDGNLCVMNVNGEKCNLSPSWDSGCTGSYYPFNPFKSFYENANDFDDTNGYSPRWGASVLVCGDGDTAVTYDDTKLGNIFKDTQVSRVMRNEYTEPVYDGVVKTWSSTYKTTILAKENLTIREIGVYVSAATTDYNKGTANILVYRKVLDEPITVPANANFILTFTTTVSASANKPADYVASASVVE